MSNTPAAPHFLRFARVLTLSAGALAGCASVTLSDAAVTDTAVTDTASADALVTDAASPDADPCSACTCTGFEPPLPDGAAPPPPSNPCGGALGFCCAAVGPLPPPELPAFAA